MLITKEINLSEYHATNGAITTLDRLNNNNKLDVFEDVLNELYPNGIDDTELNDLLWHESDWCYNAVGLMTEEEVKEKIEELDNEIVDLVAEYHDDLREEDIAENEENDYWEENYKSEYDYLVEELNEYKDIYEEEF